MPPGLLPAQVMEIALLQDKDWDQLGVSARPSHSQQVPPSGATSTATPPAHRASISHCPSNFPLRWKELQRHRASLPVHKKSFPAPETIPRCSSALTGSVTLCVLQMQFYHWILNFYTKPILLVPKIHSLILIRNIFGVSQSYLSIKS